jgi:hypothetical protein
MSLPKLGLPQNPEVMLADTSALVQLFLSDTIAPLKHLKTDYGIQVVVVEAVEAELLYLPSKYQKFSGIASPVKKAFGSHVLEVLDLNYMVQRFGNVGSSLFTQADQQGKALAAYVDRGEAYTHAAADVLGRAPTITNDMAAVWGLTKRGIIPARPILRSFDILVFGLQTGILTLAQCDGARQSLRKVGEVINPAFHNCSFNDGLPNFFPRLLDSQSSMVGSNTQFDKFDDRLWIRRNSVAAAK